MRLNKDLNIIKQIRIFLNGSKEEIADNFLIRQDSEKIQYQPDPTDVTLNKTAMSLANYGSKLFAARKQNLEVVNHCKQVLQMHLASLSQQITVQNIDGNEEFWSDTIENLSGFGDSLDDIYMQAVEEFLTTGRVGILTDSPAENPDRCFVTIFPSETILDYEYFISGQYKGKFKCIKLQESDRKIDDKTVQVFRNIFHNESTGNVSYIVFTADNKVLEEGETNLTEIPFILIGKGLKDSVLQEVFNISVARLNTNSLLQLVQKYQGFQRLHISGISDAAEVIQMSESNISYSRDAGSNIQTIEPANPTSLENKVATQDFQAIKIGMLQRYALAEGSGVSPSAESKMKDNEILVEYYTKIVSRFEKVFTKVFYYINDMMALNQTEISVHIAKNFQIMDTAVELQMLQLLLSAAIQLNNQNLQKEIVKQIILKSKLIPFSGTKEDYQTILFDMIDNNQTQQVLPLLGF